MAIFEYLSNVTRNPIKKYTGEIGLEIETETKNRYDAPEFFFWHSHGDGSLRDYGIEYVLKQPVKFKEEFPKALDEWKTKTKDIKFIPDSISTSVHVHLNILNETFKTLANFFTVYALVENLLIRYSGPDRLSNLFCLPICDAEETATHMENIFKFVNNKNYKGLVVSEGQVKYAACNLAAIASYGSIEIRSFRGETSTEKIHKWVEILYSILEFAKTDTNPKQIMDLWQKKQLDLLEIVFKENRKELRVGKELELIAKNTWYAAQVAYSVKDWDSLDAVEKVSTFKPTKKQLDSAALASFGVNFADLSDVDKQHVIFLLQKDHKIKKKVVRAPAFGLAGVDLRAAEERMIANLARAPVVPNGDFGAFPFDAQEDEMVPPERERDV